MLKDMQVLIDCGFSEKQAKVYLALLELGTSTISPVAERAQVKRTSVYNFIDELVKLGVVGRTKRRGRWYYFAESPETLLSLQEQRCRRMEAVLPSLIRRQAQAKAKPSVTYFEGATEVKNIIAEELSCQSEVLYVWPARDVYEITGGKEYLSQVDRERIKRKIKVRSIHFKQKQVAFRTSSSAKEHLREVRFAPDGLDISMGMAIFDSGKVGFFSSLEEGFGMLIESAELHKLMFTLFSYLWARSVPAYRSEVP